MERVHRVQQLLAWIATIEAEPGKSRDQACCELVIGPDSSSETLVEFASCDQLAFVAAVTINNRELNRELAQLFETHKLQSLRCLRIEDVHWGGCFDWTWSDDAIFPAIESHVETVGAIPELEWSCELPYYESEFPEHKELTGLLMSEWWKGIRRLKIQTNHLANRHIWHFGNMLAFKDIESLTLESSLLNDKMIEPLSWSGRFLALTEFKLKSPLLTKKGWARLSQIAAFPESTRKNFEELALGPELSSNAKLSQLKNLLLNSDFDDEDQFEVIFPLLAELKSETGADYEQEVLPFIRALPVRWPKPVSVEFAGPRDIDDIRQKLSLLPFLQFEIFTTQDSGPLDWKHLYESEEVLAAVVSIEFYYHLPTKQQFKELAARSKIENLRQLLFAPESKLHFAEIDVLLRSEHLKELSSLDFSCHCEEFAGQFIDKLESYIWLESLRKLRLAYSTVSAKNMSTLLDALAQSSISSLSFAETQLETEAIKRLCEEENISWLRELDFANTEMGDAGAAYLLACQQFESLEKLNLEECELSAEMQEKLEQHFADGSTSGAESEVELEF